MSEVKLTRLSSKGQIVIPKELRELMHLEDGEVFAMYGEDDTIVLKRVELPSDSEFDNLLEWGREFAEKKGITKKDVEKAISEYRKEGE
ncbi:MAG: AbrB/MazE/SpoVT family DNA-binding domain-containing protein [Candidatus Thermoplasmatota archaeon]